MSLPTSAKRHLRSLAHHLDPAVRVGGAGVTAAVIHQVDMALARELIKVRVDGDRTEVAAAATALAEGARAEVAQVIGKVIVLFRPAAKRDQRKIILPE